MFIQNLVKLCIKNQIKTAQLYLNNNHNIFRINQEFMYRHDLFMSSQNINISYFFSEKIKEKLICLGWMLPRSQTLYCWNPGFCLVSIMQLLYSQPALNLLIIFLALILKKFSSVQSYLHSKTSQNTKYSNVTTMICSSS